MRFYAVGNRYLSSIQQGIQAFHCLGEMILEHPSIYSDIKTKYMFDWLSKDKTLVCLNGGNNQSLMEFYESIKDNTSYPVAKFHEDESSMGGMLTCVGIIVPETIYGVNPNDPTTFAGLDPWELDVAFRLKRMPLAR